MPRSYRLYKPHVKTGWYHFNWGIKVPEFPVVHCSACEANLDETETLTSRLGAIKPFAGDASIYVGNVIPSVNSDGTLHVDYMLIVNWNEALNVCIDFTVFDPPEDALIGS
ncbi:hypothetical protein NLU03_32430 [Bacillus toyonensis]|nr:hypothetical protein [Bacillus toyonensis]MDT3498837.1 hypothetical protein [Bacillus toyonensis]